MLRELGDDPSELGTGVLGEVVTGVEPDVGLPFVPGTRPWNISSAPRVTGSWSPQTVRNGRSQSASTPRAARTASDAGSSGRIGTSTGKTRAPALYVSSGYGAS